MVLAQQVLARIFRDATKSIIDVINDAALIGDGDNRRLIERELDVGNFFLRRGKRLLGGRAGSWLRRVRGLHAFHGIRL